MTPYDEQQVLDYGDDVSLAYSQASQTIDAGVGVWFSRMQYDAITIGYPASRDKHLKELRTALGLSIPFSPLPPFDVSDSGGIVHTVLPPEQVIPTQPDVNFWYGDFAGVTLTEKPPFVPGANTTPPEMVMSFLLHEYDFVWQDKILQAHMNRGYTHFHLGGESSIDLFHHVQSLGFFTSYWATDTNKLKLLNDKTIMIIGGEINTKMSPEALQVFINEVSNIAHSVGAKVGIHFTSNIPSWQPNSMSSYQWWASLEGKIDFLCWQGDQNNSAGTMGAHLWDARFRVANHARVVAFELIASNQLYNKPLADGRSPTEDMGKLRGWEMLCSTRTSGSNIRAVSGVGNGAAYPDGSSLIRR